MTTEDVAGIERRIDLERAELSRTVALLAERADIKARARDAAGSAGRRLRQTSQRYARPRVLVPVFAAVAALSAAAIWWRRQR